MQGKGGKRQAPATQVVMTGSGVKREVDMATEAVGPGTSEQVPWWLVLIEGFALLLLGVMLLMNTGEAAIVIVMFVGIYWLIAGIFRIIHIFIDATLWGWNLLVGMIGIAAGILVVQYPLWSTGVIGNTIIIIMGIMGILFGLGNIIGGIQGKSWGAVILGVFSLIIGLALLANIWLFTFSLPYALGIIAIIGGVSAIISAVQLRS